MSDLTPETIAELKRLEPISASGPWVASSRRLSSETDAEFFIADDMGHSCNDAELIAALRNAAPALIAAAEECERLRERVKNLESQIKQADELVRDLERNQCTHT